MSDDEVNDLEAIRARNIAERNAFLRGILSSIEEDKAEINRLENTRRSLFEKENKPPQPTRKRRASTSSLRPGSPNNSFRGVRLQIQKTYNTRSQKRKKEDAVTYNKPKDIEDMLEGKDIVFKRKKRSLLVMFPWSRPMQRDIDLMFIPSDPESSEDDDDVDDDDDRDDNLHNFVDTDSDNSDEDKYRPKKKRVCNWTKAPYDPSTIPSPDEVTDSMLRNIAQKASGKVYDAHNGTSCHQCRQKTKDTKTVCRSGRCVGVRGQFCGPCLNGRYGESAYDALLNPTWECPPCRKLCNCSICRTRNGQRPTGILAPIAKTEGYNSVKDYLQAIDSDEEPVEEEEDDDDPNEEGSDD